MVKIMIITSLLILFSNKSSAQTNNLWWLRTPENTIYEEYYKHGFSEIKEGILKEEIEKFIKSYITYSNNNKEAAVEIKVLSEKLNGEKKYQISLIENYYDEISTNSNIQQIVMVNNVIVFFRYSNFKEVKIKDEILYGLLRSRYPNETENLNKEYKEYQQKENGAIPVIVYLSHRVISWVISIKDNLLVNKEYVSE